MVIGCLYATYYVSRSFSSRSRYSLSIKRSIAFLMSGIFGVNLLAIWDATSWTSGACFDVY